VACWGIAIFTLGNVLAATFQLAHCVDEADFIGTRGTQGDCAEHQIATTVDFARANGLLGWYLGGLNLQVEHRLFPQVCHLQVPEPPETPDSVPGTVYELGPHRLLCGDSTEAATVQKLAAGERASLLWTDAPYNVAYEGAAGSIMRTTRRGGAFGRSWWTPFAPATP
jgi:hypothetical protein